jgi:hypothetical protein
LGTLHNLTEQRSPLTIAQEKPRPILTSMPTEILEKIIALAIPDVVRVVAWYKNWGLGCQRTIWEQMEPLNWEVKWVPGLLLVSKTIRQITRKVLVRDDNLNLEVRSIHFIPDVPVKLRRKTGEHFKEMLTRDEGHGLAASEHAAKV